MSYHKFQCLAHTKDLKSVVNFVLCFLLFLCLSFLCPVLLIQGASMYFPAAEGTSASQSFPSSSTPHTVSNPPPFAPLTSLLPYRVHDLSAWAPPAAFHQKMTKEHMQIKQKVINRCFIIIIVDVVVRKGGSTTKRKICWSEYYAKIFCFLKIQKHEKCFLILSNVCKDYNIFPCILLKNKVLSCKMFVNEMLCNINVSTACV